MGILRLPTQKTQSRIKLMYIIMYNDYEGYTARYTTSILVPQNEDATTLELHVHTPVNRAAQRSN